MLINERQIEDNSIIEKFKKKGYRHAKKSEINKNIILEQDLLKFLKSSCNIKNFNNLLKNDFNYEQEILEEAIKQIQDKIIEYENIAFLLREGISVKGKKFILFEGKYNSLGVNDSFKNNLFTVCNQYHHRINFEKIGEQFSRYPDIIVFINGIFFSYIEFKYVNRSGQTAKDQGRKQIIDNYKDLICNYVIPESNYIENEKEKERFIEDCLKFYEKSVHCVTSDMQETYVHRFLKRNLRNKAKKINNENYKDSDFHEDVLENFKLLPQNNSISLEEIEKRLIDSIDKLYSKESINNEIFYYNFLFNNELIAPRPKQKHGVDSTINHIYNLYNNRKNQKIYNYELENKLPFLSKNSNNNLKKFDSFKKNQEIYSVLLQYSAGFGKSLIIAWLSLRLKDICIENPIFDTIFIIADRLDLKDQMSNTMNQMNIDSSLIKEITSNKILKQELLEEKSKIVIVNIQKFNEYSLDKIFTEEILKNLRKKRVAFIIDEIHRSQSGFQHHNMKNMFDDLYNQIKNDNNKKNTIIGLTATPSNEVLDRFGEHTIYNERNINSKPFDSYTMKEAIDDGFILNPLENIICIGIEPELHKKQKEEAENKEVNFNNILNSQYYEDNKRSLIVADYIVKFSIMKTFPLINGHGKSMVVSYSIESAIQLYKNIKNKLQLFFENNKEYSNKENCLENLYIVYSGESKNNKKASFFNRKNEQEVIEKFRKCKNGIIVVVNKLQTGFDVKELNALFLDKTINGISAVQTCSRINRLTENKNECFIFDFSKFNENKKNIENAFNKFSNLTTYSLESFDNHENKVIGLYHWIINNNIYKQFSEIWKKYQEEGNEKYSIELQKKAIEYRNNNKDYESLLNFIKTGTKYLNYISLMEKIIYINEKYIIDDFFDLLKEIKNSAFKNNENNRKQFIELLFNEKNHGIIDVSSKKNNKNGFNSKNQNKLHKENKNDYNSFNKVINSIKQIEKHRKKIEYFKECLNNTINEIINMDKEKNNRVLNEMKKNNEDKNNEDINKWLKGYAHEYIKQCKNNEDITPEFSEFIEKLKQLESQILIEAIREEIRNKI